MTSRPPSVIRGAVVCLVVLVASALSQADLRSAAARVGDTTLGRAIKRVIAPVVERGRATMFVPSVSATMTDAIINDVDGDLRADPGDTIRYTTTIAVSVEPATGVVLNTPIDLHTTLVGGSISVSPLAIGESYQSVGNMTLTSADIGADCTANPLRSVTCNDLTAGAPLTGFGATQGTAAGTVVNGSNTVTTSNGGTVLLNTDGTFVYNPATGFEGTDSFWYTLSNAAGSDNAPVSITVGGANGMAWFVSSAGGGTGRQANPISLDGLRAINNGTGNNPNINDTIFVFEGTHALTATLTLLTNQKLLGQDITGTTFPVLGAPAAQPGNSLPGVNPSGDPVDITSTAAAITLGSNNEIAGFTVGNATTAITGGAVGDLNVREVIINTSGAGLIITTSGVMTTTAPFTGFTSLTSGGGTNGVSLTGVTGTVALPSGAITGATGTAFNVSGGSAAVSYGGTITQNNAQRLISVSNTTAGSVSFTNGSANALTGGASSTGILIDGAAGSVTINNADLNGTRGVEILGDATNNATGTFTFNNVTIDTVAGAGNHAFIVDGDQGTPGNNDVAATIDLNNVDITNPGGQVATIQGMNGGSIDFDSASAITRNNGGLGILANSNAGGTVTLNSSTLLLTTSTNNAVSLTSNTGATFSFAGGIDIDTTTGVGFNATGGGTVNVSGGTRTINTTTGQAVVMNGVAIGSSNVSFGTIALSGSPTSLDALSFTGVTGNTFNGGNVTVAGTTTAGDGIEINGSGATFNFASATIDNTAGAGLNLTGANGAVTFTTVDIDGTTGAGIDIASNTNAVSVNGGTIGATNDPGGNVVDVSAGSGSVTIVPSLTKTTAGRIVEITGRTGTATIDVTGSLNCSSTCTGINVANTNTSGTTTINFSNVTKNLNTDTNAAVTLATNPNAVINFTNGGLNIDTTSGAGFTATGGGTVNVSGASNNIDTTGGAALTFNGVTSTGTVNFNNINSTTGGAVSVTSSGATDFTFNDVSSTTGTAVSITTATGDFIFHLISSNGGAKGISVTSATGTFTVNGTSTTDGTGGTIQNKTARGAEFISSNNITLRNMNFTANGDGDDLNCGDGLGASTNSSFITNAACESNIHLQSVTTVVLNNVNAIDGGAHGIVGIGVNGLTLTNVEALRNGSNTIVGEDGVQLVNLSGTVNVTGGIFRDNSSRAFEVQNNTGTPTITIDGAFFGNTNFPTAGGTAPSPSNSTANGSVLLATNGTNSASITSVTRNSTFQRIYSIAFFVDMAGNTSQNVTFGQAGQGNQVLTASQGISIVGTNSGGLTASVVDNVVNNDETLMDTFASTNINFRRGGGGSPASGNWTATIDNNDVGISGNTKSGCEIAGCSGISADDQGSPSGTFTMVIQNNTIYNVSGGINVGSANDGAHTIRATIINNTVQEPDTTPQGGAGVSEGNGIFVFSGTSFDGSTFVRIEDNNVDGGWAQAINGDAIRVRHQGDAGSQFFVCNISPSPANSTQTRDFLIAENPLTSDADGGGTTFDAAGAAATLGYTFNNGCPLTLAEGGIEATHPGEVPALTPVDVDQIGAAAIARWGAAGLSPAQFDGIRKMTFEMADLPGDLLAEIAGDRLRINSGAGRARWFVDPTPMDDVEFGGVASPTRLYTDSSGAPAGRMDLLTAMMHEMGHQLGLADSYALADRDSLMFGHLTTGERRLPAFGQAARATTIAFHVADPLGRPGDSLVAPWGPAPVAARGTAFATGRWPLPAPLVVSARRLPTPARGTAFTAEQLPSPAPLARWVSSQLVSAAAVTRSAMAVTGSVVRRAAADTLAVVRSVPDLLSATLEARSGETVNQPIGTIPAGKTVTVIFDVTVDPGRQPQYSAQGTVSGSNFSSFLTDDPAFPGGADPTITSGDLFDTTTTLDAAPASPQFVSQDVTLTATVESEVGGGTPTGSVTFRETGVDITGCVGIALNGSGIATCDIPGGTFTSGAKSFTAHFGGSSEHDPSASTALPYTYDDCIVAPNVTTGLLANDGAPGSLRFELAGACPAATITFTATGNIDIGDDGSLQIVRDVTIDGPGAASVTVRRVSAVEFPVFYVAPGVAVIIRDVTIQDGTGGIENDTATLTVDRVRLFNNQGVFGGGIRNIGSGTLVVRDSTLEANTATGSGGGIHNATGNVTIINSTITGNLSDGHGGGIFHAGSALTVINATITANRADVNNDVTGLGGGLFSVGAAAAPVLRNTIVAGNFSQSAGSSRDDVFGDVDVASTSNLIGDGSNLTGITHGTNGNLVGSGVSPIDPLLGGVANNGGTTGTHALLTGSPALDAGAAVIDPITSLALATDQRGQPRPVDDPFIANASSGDGSDIGAFEAPATPTAPDLQAASDTGLSPTDNITTVTTPTFDVAGVTIGATVELLVDGVVTATDTAAATTIALTSTALTEGPHSVTARQTVAGGTSPISSALVVTIDTTVPSTPTIDLDAASDTGISNSDDLTNATTRVFNIANTDLGTNMVLNRNGSSVFASSGTGGALLMSDDSSFVSGTTYAYVARQTDTAGNFAESIALNVTIDNTRPDVALSSAAGNPTSTSPIPVTVTFTEGVYGFTAGNLVAGNGTVGNFAGTSGDASYTFDLTPAGQGAVTVDLGADVSTDAAGNTNTAATQFSRNYDTVGPTAAITAVTPDPRSTSVSSIDIVFNQAVTGVTVGDFTLTRDGGADLLTGSENVTSGDGITWTLDTLAALTGTAGSYTLTLTAAGAGIEDLAGNALIADASDTWVLENTPPTVTINQAAGQADPAANASTVNFTVVFNEPINTATFTDTDLDLSGGTAATTTITITEIAPSNGTTFNVAFSGNSPGDLVAAIQANVVEDLAGNLNDPSTSTDNTVTLLECLSFAATVTSTDDSGPGTLREALANVCSTGTITFDIPGPGPHTISVTTGAMFVDRDVTILGPANERVILDGGGTNDLMFILPETTVRIERLTFANGYSPGEGAALFNLGFTSIFESTFTGNVSEFDGGAITNEGILGLANTTVSGNTALAGVGGGIFNCTDGILFLLNATITNNHAGDLGGGLYNITDVYMENTILAGNTAVTDGANLYDDDGGVTNDFGHNLLSGDPRIGPLQNNGGPTQSHAPLPGSPAIDAGDTTIVVPVPLFTDQRGVGFGRIRAGASAGATQLVDIGAIEADPSIEDISDKTTPEATPFAFTFYVGDAASAFEPFVVSSSNTTLLPDENLELTQDTPSSWTLTVTPAAGQSGTSTVTVTVSKIIGGAPVSMSDTFVVTVTPVASTPSITGASTLENTQTTSGLVITRNPGDGPEVTHFKITAISGGLLFQNDGVTPIALNAFITAAEGGAGLRFTPAPNMFGPALGTIGARASLSDSDAGLGGGEATGIVTVLPVANTPSITNALTVVDRQTTSGLVITRNPLDGPEVSHFKITAVTGGTLFHNDGVTPIAPDTFITAAQGAAGLRFTPSSGSSATGHVSVQASVSNTNAGLGGGIVTADIIVIGAFSDDPIVAGVTPIRLLHLLEMRARVNALRVRFGLAEVSFSMPVVGVSMVTGQHLLQVRTALSEAYTAAGVAAPTFTDPGLPAGTVIKAVHIQELRAAIIALEGS